MKNVKFLFILIITLSVSSLYSQAKSKGINIQEVIDNASKKGVAVTLEAQKHYYIDKTLEIKTSIIGNNAVIEPLMNSAASVIVSSDNIKIENLNFRGEKLKTIQINGNGVNFNNCSFENKTYGNLILVRGDNLSITNSKIRNNYNQGPQYAIRNPENKAIKGFTLSNSEIYGGIRLTNEEDKEAGNYLFTGNKIYTDYTHAKQNLKTQHDAIRLGGVKNVLIEKNEFQFKNVNRGFKFTDYQPGKKKQRSKRPVDQIKIINNKITSNSINGKQLFDLYDGTGAIEIIDNKINSIGHIVIIEDKTYFPVDAERKLQLIGNEIRFDFRVLYYRGVDKEKVSIIVRNNTFVFQGKKANMTLKRIGQENEFDQKYLFYFRTLKEFNFDNNKLVNVPTDNKIAINIVDVDKGCINNSDLVGIVQYKANAGNKLVIENNKLKGTSLNKLLRITTNSSATKTYNVEMKNNSILK